MQVRKVNMTRWFIIILVCWALCAPKIIDAGTEVEGSLKGINGLRIPLVGLALHSRMTFVQKDPEKPSNTDRNDGVSKDMERTPPSEPRTKDKNAPKHPKQITPFVPSEKIPADQGVDFPYDI